MRNPSSGDPDNFNTTGKKICRDFWNTISYEFYKIINKKLNTLWLANSDFSDIYNKNIFNKIVVPENNYYEFKNKNNNLQNIKNIELINCKLSDYLDSCNLEFDIINLDFLSHFNISNFDCIRKSLRKLRSKHPSFLFITLAKHSNFLDRLPNHSQLLNKPLDIRQSIETCITTNNIKYYSLQELDNCLIHPKTLESNVYLSKGNSNNKRTRRNQMFSFAWELYKS